MSLVWSLWSSELGQRQDSDHPGQVTTLLWLSPGWRPLCSLPSLGLRLPEGVSQSTWAVGGAQPEAEGPQWGAFGSKTHFHQLINEHGQVQGSVWGVAVYLRIPKAEAACHVRKEKAASSPGDKFTVLPKGRDVGNKAPHTLGVWDIWSI